jgi:RNA polymerase sigma-70 factor (ECF subfamily)
MEPLQPEEGRGLEETLVDDGPSPFETMSSVEIRERVEMELKQVPEPYRTTVILRDIEEFSYEEIAEILQVSLGTVKSRLMRGRDALKKRLASYVEQTRTDMSGRGHDAPSATAGVTVKKVEVPS